MHRPISIIHIITTITIITIISCTRIGHTRLARPAPLSRPAMVPAVAVEGAAITGSVVVAVRSMDYHQRILSTMSY
uniref:Uncharacterized protein n=1 Tax=Anopheles darlingi TaxID=43151 RepID=A0A2M4D132_ANODA